MYCTLTLPPGVNPIAVNKNLSIYAFCEIMWKNMVQPVRPQTAINHCAEKMQFSCCITKKRIERGSEYVILFVFPRQQWLSEGSSVALLTYIACPYCYTIVSAFYWAVVHLRESIIQLRSTTISKSSYRQSLFDVVPTTLNWICVNLTRSSKFLPELESTLFPLPGGGVFNSQATVVLILKKQFVKLLVLRSKENLI